MVVAAIQLVPGLQHYVCWYKVRSGWILADDQKLEHFSEFPVDRRGFVLIGLRIKSDKCIEEEETIPHNTQLFKSSQTAMSFRGENEYDTNFRRWEKKENLIGVGAFSAVYRIPETNPPLALKLYSSWEDDERQKEISNEISVLQRIRHKLIVEYVGHLIEELYGSKWTVGIILRMFQKESLHDYIFNGRYVYTMYTVLCWMEQLFRILVYLQEKSILHRDIKPANIFVDSSCFIILGDFGAAKFTNLASGSYVGTERYMCPELLFQEEVSHLSDLYSVGIVAWEMIERRYLFKKYIRDNRFNVSDFKSDLYSVKDVMLLDELDCSKSVKEIIYDCTRFNPNDRRDPQVITEILNVKKRSYELKFGSSVEFLPVKQNDSNIIYKPRGFKGGKELVAVTNRRNDSESSKALAHLSVSLAISNRLKEKESEPQSRVSSGASNKKEDQNALQIKRILSKVENKNVSNYLETLLTELDLKVFDLDLEFETVVRAIAEREVIMEMTLLQMSIFWQMHIVGALAFPAVKSCLQAFEYISNTRTNIGLQEEVRCYQNESGIEFILLGLMNRNSLKHNFVQCDSLLKILTLNGEWTNEEDYMYNEKETNEKKIMKFVRLEHEFSRLSIFQQQNQLIVKLARKWERFISKSYGQDLPVKGYIFQLSHLPIGLCKCEIECPFSKETFELGRHRSQFLIPNCIARDAYSAYLGLYVEFSELIIRLESTMINDLSKLITTLSKLAYLKSLIAFTTAPKYFLFYTVKGFDEVIVVNLPDNELAKVLVINIPTLNLLSIECSDEEIDMTNIYRLDIENFLADESLIRKIFAIFVNAYEQRTEPCSFLKNLDIEMADFDYYSTVIYAVLLACYKDDFLFTLSTEEIKRFMESRRLIFSYSEIFYQEMYRTLKNEKDERMSRSMHKEEQNEVQEMWKKLFEIEQIIENSLTQWRLVKSED